MRCNKIIKTADYEKTNNYIMKMMMRDDYSEEEWRDTRTADDEENVLMCNKEKDNEGDMQQPTTNNQQSIQLQRQWQEMTTRTKEKDKWWQGGRPGARGRHVCKTKLRTAREYTEYAKIITWEQRRRTKRWHRWTKAGCRWWSAEVECHRWTSSTLVGVVRLVGKLGRF